MPGSGDNKELIFNRAVRFFKPKQWFFSQNRREPKLRIFAPDERLFESGQQARFTGAA